MILNCGGQGYVDSSNGTVTEIYGCGIEAGAFTPAEHTDVLGPAFAKSGAPKYKLTIFHLLVGFLTIASLVSCDIISVPDEEYAFSHNAGLFNATGLDASEHNVSYVLPDRTVLFDLLDCGIISNSTSLSKRANQRTYGCMKVGLLYRSCKKMQVTQEGTWWTSWEPASNCLFNSLGDEGTITVSASYTKGWSHTSGVDFNFGDIKATASYTISESYTIGQSMTCKVPAQKNGRVYAQMKMYWADTQIQECQTSGQDNYLECGAFGPYLRINAPISDGHVDNRAFGCSTGANANCN